MIYFPITSQFPTKTCMVRILELLPGHLLQRFPNTQPQNKNFHFFGHSSPHFENTRDKTCQGIVAKSNLTNNTGRICVGIQGFTKHKASPLPICINLYITNNHIINIITIQNFITTNHQFKRTRNLFLSLWVSRCVKQQNLRTHPSKTSFK